MIPHQGLSLESLTRGVMGMLILILIAYALSNNRKNIPWKIVGLGSSCSVDHRHWRNQNLMDQNIF